ncbi:endonuclease/exonuclease/phosphatase [Trichococcus palustris]|uniref:Endonuclease/exonuclease/phosphatase n=1 Tax=Trichococcus palustris TaxID=140314 RepID=A0A143YUK3_9LACT|nr:endonuclease/exonuclease/phosphatase family protein [Trichococcus palustris]CZQ98583.1 endonuclease/exonuclease/phosphatase [Trichococcus palustris]SFK94404.1 maltose 6'-phosphate phosphatase [Trichococcus palustris]
MKLLTLNTYSWVDTADVAAYAALITDILENEYDAIALQEVNQLSSGPAISNPQGYLATQTEIPIKEDNFAYFLVKALAEKNLFYHWSWVPCHVGYVRFDEGIAILSKEPIQAVEQIQLSTINDFQSYHTRRGLLVQTESACFVSVHLSWWKDEEENPFLTEWRSLETAVKKTQDKPVYIMGDINNPADIRNEGYDLITRSGWHDAYANAAVREGAATVPPAIAGWEENTRPLRIDYIFSNREQAVAKYEIKFDGNKQPCVSDHYGVAVTYS